MPEGPEVTILVKNISKYIKNKTLKNIEFLSGRYTKKKPSYSTDIINELHNNKIKINDIHNKGKFIWIELNNDWNIWITLGMTGFLFLEEQKDITSHTRIKFTLKNNAFYFEDMRNFGTIKFSNSFDDLQKKLNTLGFDPLQCDLTTEKFNEILNKSKSTWKIGDFLMRQNKLSGIGNYLRAEILYDCKISPHRTLNSLDEKDKKYLVKSINKIMTKSYKSQETDIESEKNYTEGFTFKVYGKKFTKKKEKVLHEELAKRTIWWVPSVQK